uniref:Uncharacterized protein n=1 Tax=Leersia perrieri TaxID=77586 RepID=A0A0D9XSF6_9ORYZ
MRERNQRGGRKEPTVDHIKHANWKGVADFLDALLKKNELEPNDELAHLLEKLKEKSSINYCDLVWEPGLWTTMVKIHFVREVYWSIKGDRKSVLENTNPLGIKTFMTKLGYSSNQEKSLLDSILFLRKRVVAHQDTTYLSYNGDKNEVGESKRSVELLLQKTKADYMIELVSHIRRLGWLIESPILRSKTQYMEAFRQSKK